MRLRYPKFTLFVVVATNLFIFYRFFNYYGGEFLTNNKTPQLPQETSSKNSKPTSSTKQHTSKLVTIIIREFELNENDVSLTAQSFLNAFPQIQIFVISEGLPYPPLEIFAAYNANINSSSSSLTSTSTNLRLINLESDILTSSSSYYSSSSSVLSLIKTRYVLFVPDSTRILNKQALNSLLSEKIKEERFFKNDVDRLMVAANLNGVNANSLKVFKSQKVKSNLNGNTNCLNVDVDLKQWSVKYSGGGGGGGEKNGLCDAVFGKHVLLVETEVLRKLNDAFLRPFPKAFYLQTSVFGYKVKLVSNLQHGFQEGRPIFKSHHAQWKLKKMDKEREKKLYKRFKIKQVIHPNQEIEWFGCNRTTNRCFPPVINSMPSYLFEGKWTPPCCLKNLRKTALHVFQVLDESGIRYWLESGSLLGAMRQNDILLWDHDVDIGINRDDIPQCPYLEKAKFKQTIDKNGFVWEKATEGNFFRVHYSKQNRIYVNLYPFFSRNGTMTPDSWFLTKNMEFPEVYLHPMSSIEFIGRHVPSPNNIRDFLELKFGRGAIENPQYPKPDKLKFP